MGVRGIGPLWIELRTGFKEAAMLEGQLGKRVAWRCKEDEEQHELPPPKPPETVAFSSGAASAREHDTV